MVGFGNQEPHKAHRWYLLIVFIVFLSLWFHHSRLLSSSVSLLCHWFVRETRSFVLHHAPHSVFGWWLPCSNRMTCFPSPISSWKLARSVFCKLHPSCYAEHWMNRGREDSERLYWSSKQEGGPQMIAMEHGFGGCMDRGGMGPFNRCLGDRTHRTSWLIGKERASADALLRTWASPWDKPKRQLSPGKTLTCLLTFSSPLSFMVNVKGIQSCSIIVGIKFYCCGFRT